MSSSGKLMDTEPGGESRQYVISGFIVCLLLEHILLTDYLQVRVHKGVYEDARETERPVARYVGCFELGIQYLGKLIPAVDGSSHAHSDIKAGLEPGERKEDYGQSSTGENGFGGRTIDVSGEADKGILFIVLLFYCFIYSHIQTHPSVEKENEKKLTVVYKDLKSRAPGDDEEARKSRREQRYGPGSGVGA